MGSHKRLPPAKHLQSVIEWRYPRAHRYWDDCGKLISAVEAAFPGLKCQGLGADGFTFAGPSAGLVEAKFYWDKARLVVVGQGQGQLPEASRRFWGVIADGLSIETRSFLGHRSFLCCELASVKEAVRWLDNQPPLWTFASTEGPRLGTPQTAGSVLRTQIADGERRLRLDIQPGTISIKGEGDHHGIILDADIVVQAPNALPQDVGDFVSWNLEFIRSTVAPLYRGK